MVKRALLTVLLLAHSAHAERDQLKAVKHWGYQLQGGLPRASDALDLVIIDAADDGVFLTPAQVRGLKRRPGKADRLVLAYLSIGEAESYRYYWQKSWSHSPPPFVAAENRQWRENYKVRYWSAEWQAIVQDYLDRIVAAGFDGAYLDIIDAFEYFAPDGPHPERKTAAEDMGRFVALLAHHARAERAAPNFLIVPQNGALLLERLSAAGAAAYLDAVDAIAAEDTFYFGGRKENNELNVQKETLTALERFRDAGKPVLSVEYVTEPAKVKQFAKLARAHRFIPCIARRKLDQLLELPE